jgi:hypothetical protein
MEGSRFDPYERNTYLVHRIHTGSEIHAVSYPVGNCGHYNFARGSVWMRNLVSKIKGGTQTEGV